MDYSSMKATKKSRQKFDGNVEVSRKDSKKINRSLKKLKLNWFMVVACILIGVAAGFFAMRFAFSKDTFQMNTYANGKTDVTIGAQGDMTSYTELGVSCVAFGKDCSKDVTITYFYRTDLTEKEVKVDGVDTSKAGMYYVVYETDVSKYKTITLIRNVIVLEEEA